MNDELKEIAGRVLFILGGTPVTVATLLTAVMIVIFTFFVSSLLQRALARAFKMRGVKREGTVAVAKRLLHYVVLFVGFGVALDTLGFSLSALFAAGAVFAIGIGFAMQEIAQNFVSGVILLLERSIKPGDVLKVEGRFVEVRHLGVRSTLVRTRDEEELIVPNSALVQSTVTNYTLKDTLYRLRATAGVVYSSDMELVYRTLEEVAEGVSWRTPEKEPSVLLKDFGDSAVVFEVSVWIDDPWKMQGLRSQLNQAIWRAFLERDIVIAFPQLDVHFDREVADSLAARAAS